MPFSFAKYLINFFPVVFQKIQHILFLLHNIQYLVLLCYKYILLLCARGVYGKAGALSFQNEWRNNKTISGGGIMLDQGIHMLDLMYYFIISKAFFSITHCRSQQPI